MSILWFITKESMKYFMVFYGSLTIYLSLSLLHCSFTVSYCSIQIYSCLLVYTYCRILALCTTWFVNSPFNCGEPSPVPLNNNLKALGPCFNLGLDIIQKRTLIINLVNLSITSTKMYGLIADLWCKPIVIGNSLCDSSTCSHTN